MTIIGPGASQLTIDGNAGVRIFDIALGNTVSISGMTLTNSDSGGLGGAIIQNASSTLSLNAMVITDNDAATGAGIYTERATLNITNSTISNNEAENFGGGIFNAESTVTITDSVISGNTARVPEGPFGFEAGGGGIHSNTTNAGSLTITGSTISDNCAGTRSGLACNAGSRGGGIAAFGASITNSRILGNTAIDGGGIYHTRDLTLTNSTISGNTATAVGGGTYSNIGPALTVTGSTFVGNTAGTAGGGVYHQASDPSSIRNSTFSANSAPTGGSLWIFTAGVTSVSSSTFSGGTVHNESSGGFQLPVSNSIFAASCTGVDIVDGGFNIDSGNGCGFTAPTSKINTDPLLRPLENNGGPTLTMALRPGSPAIDQGSAFCPGPQCVTADQRGQARPNDLPDGFYPNAGDGTDIGAFESLGPTAAQVSVSGRVLDAHGRAIRGAIVTVEGIDGFSRRVMTNTFGYYRFNDLAAGATYIASVTARRHTFAEASRVISLEDNLSGLDFVANR